jgi:hypothetical protein
MKKLIILAIAVISFTACSREEINPISAQNQTPRDTAQQASPPSNWDSFPKPGKAEQDVAFRFTDYLNNGQRDSVSALLSPNTIFDRAGTIFNGRNTILNNFLIPDVINPRGKYERLRWRGDVSGSNIIVIEYYFRIGATFVEHFTYRFTIVNGSITNVIGRYVV